MVQEIFDFAATIGQVQEGESDTLLHLCQAAHDELIAKLRQGVTVETCKAAFIIAAAWIALAGLCISREDEDIISWSAGDVSVQKSRDAGNRPEVYRAQAERLMAPYMKDSGFTFLGVKG